MEIIALKFCINNCQLYAIRMIIVRMNFFLKRKKYILGSITELRGYIKMLLSVKFKN